MNNTIPSNATNIVLFGCQGDLTRRKLLPSLYHLEQAQLLSCDTQIICVGRTQLETNSYREQVKSCLYEFVDTVIDEAVLSVLIQKITYLSIDLIDKTNYQQLVNELGDNSYPIINYFAVPAEIYGNICQGLAFNGLNHPQSRVVLEKPIGHDLLSSKIINDEVARYFTEEQIYRIDHYLGKETVLNLLDLRFANSLFSSKWDNTTIDHIQITVAEEVGIEGRWSYFDKAGQMRDMLQNHLIQILSLVTMDPPLSLASDTIRDEKVKVLKALRPITVDNVFDCSVRGQYSNGFLQGKAVPSYRDEEGANKHSTTESFVALKVHIDNWRWAGVPFYLRTGKRMAKKVSEIVVYFKNPAHNLYRDYYSDLPSNKLTIRLQPEEGIEIQMLNKVPGLAQSQRLQTTKLDLSFSQAFEGQRIADAYERLLMEAIKGNQALFVRRDEVEASWQWCDGILSAWQSTGQPLASYPAGSSGPVAAIGLIARDGRAWDE